MSTDPQMPPSSSHPSYRTLSVTPLTPTIGAEITGVDLREAMGPEVRDELRRALREHLVIFLRGQDLSDEQHMSAAASFGSPATCSHGSRRRVGAGGGDGGPRPGTPGST